MIGFRKICPIFLLFLPFFLFANLSVYSRENKNTDLEQGIWDYQHENYDEALDYLKRAREEDPQSSLAAYYLGITYKKLQDYKEAKPHLEDAVKLKPHIKGALVELIDLLYRLDDTEEANKWIGVAEKQEIRPAQVAFLKGLVLLKEGTDLDKAIDSLEEAKELDDSMSQVVDYHIGVAHLKSERLREAGKIFKQIALKDPSTDLARFANEFIDIIKEREEKTRPLHLAVGCYWQYDDNVVLKPEDDTVAIGVSDKSDNRQVYTVKADYDLRFWENFGTRFGYSLYYAKQTHLGFYDTVGNNFSIQPSIYLDKVAISFPATYNHLVVNDKNYLSQVSVGNLNNLMVADNQMAQASFVYRHKDYLWDPAIEDEGRDGNEFLWTAGYYLFFAKNKGFVNLKYAANLDNTEGQNWDYFGNKATATALVPLLKRVNLTVAGEFFLQNFLNRNTIFDNKRLDGVFQLSSLLSVELFKGAELQLQYTYVDNTSNIGVYDYRRNIYSAGVQFKY